MNNNRTIRLISPKQVIGHFKQHNIELSNAEAEKYLGLLYFSADKIVK
jgi:hypothetical protein